MPLESGPPTIEIAMAKPEDAAAIQDVQYRAWLATYPNKEHGITAGAIEDRYKDRQQRLQKKQEEIKNLPPNIKVLVAKDRQKVIGFIRVSKGENRNQLQTLYVLPDYQGKGVGGSLWEEIKSFLEREKATFVHVATYNENAVTFYEKMGFVDTGKRFTNDRMFKSGLPIPEMELERKADI